MQPIRREVQAYVLEQINQTGNFSWSQIGNLQARENLKAATQAYHEARRTMLAYDLTSAYGVVVWGSARIKPTSSYGKLVRNFVQELVEASKSEEDNQAIPLRIVTGGGPGLMEAANLGAHLAIEHGRNNGSKVTVLNYGVPILGLSRQETPNVYISNKGEEEHPEFTTRKQRMLDLTHGCFIAAGGFGTLYEAFMALQNKQTGHGDTNYLIVAHNFWRETVDVIYDSLYHQRVRGNQTPLIAQKDLELVQFVRRPEEAIEIFLPSIRQWWKDIGSKVVRLP